MYYEEKLIDGVMCWRGVPDGEWTPYTLKELSARYAALCRAAGIHPADDQNHVHPHDCGYAVTGHIHNCNCKPECETPHDETPKQACGDCDPCLGGRMEPETVKHEVML